MKREGEIGLVVRKCVCARNPCICGSHPSRLANPEAHRRFVRNIFAMVGQSGKA